MARDDATSAVGRPGVLGRIDPITFEILRHRLWVIQGELGTTIKAMSGSPVASEAGDFNTCLMDADGNGVLSGLYISAQAAVTPWVVRSILSDYGLDHVQDGDMFLCNDPWKGALHQNDVACVAPVFIEQRIVGWVGSVIHQLDVGGPVPGGFALGARSVFEEAPIFPAVRIVRGGVIQPDVEAGYLRRSRMAPLMRLDLRAQIAANSIAIERLREVAAAYSTDILVDVFAGMIEMVERKLGQRLRGMAQCRFQETVLLDDDGIDSSNVYAIVIDVTNGPDGLVLDFSHSSPQAPALINCTRTALDGGVVAGMLAVLCHDLPWTPASIERCVRVVSKPGTVCDATWPAGVSGGSVLGARSVAYGVMSALGRLASLGGETERAFAGFSSYVNLVQLFGVRTNGQPFGTMLMETGQGIAASAARDGMDSGGLPDGPGASSVDVETTEMTLPLLYLYRRENPDTGGAGIRRGGTTVSSAFQMRDGSAGVFAIGQGYGWPISFGLMGGQPGRPLNNFHVTGIAEGDMDALDALAGPLQELFGGTREAPSFNTPSNLDLPLGQANFVRLSAKHRAQLAPGDVYATGGGGASGFGDPWARPVVAVVQDVEQGYVSPAGALASYGVAICEKDGRPAGERNLIRSVIDGQECIEGPVLVDGRRAVRFRTYENSVLKDDRLELVLDEPVSRDAL